MKTPKGKDLTLFVRFGGLDLKNQKGYGSENFHSPPSSRGIYAFPKIAQEMFLVGSLDKYQPGILAKYPEYPKDKEIDINGRKKLSDVDRKIWEETRDSFDWDQNEKQRRKRYSEIRKEFKKTNGNVWHHLGDYCRNNIILKRNGSWVKTSIADWQKAFSKASLNNRYGEGFFSSKSINNTRGIAGCYSKDHYEVFFDEKI